MLHEFINNDSQFEILFKDFFGGYWRDDLKNIIKEKIQPNLMEENLISIGLEHTETDILLEKDKIKFILEINKFDDISLILKSELIEENKEKLRQWATIIENEIEKLK